MQFEIKALRANGEVFRYALDAPNAEQAAHHAKTQGYPVLGIHAVRGYANWRRQRRSGFPLGLFSQELLSLLTAGLSLVEALEALTEKEQHAESRSTLETMVARLYQGQPLSTAMQEFPAIFPQLYVATVRASEKTGGISEALGRYVAYQSQLDAIRKKIVNASIYPALLLVVGSLVVLFLMAYVVPKFAAVYEGTDRNLPFLSRVLLNWGALLHSHGSVLLAVLGLLIGAAAYGVSRREFRQWMLLRLWDIPALGQRLHVYQLARFYRTLGMLLKGGVPLVSAMEMVAPILQPALRAHAHPALQSIREGRSTSEALQAHQLTTPVALRMLRVGERAGNMGEMMERIAAFYDEDMARWVDWFTRLFEPILMTVIGLVIGFIVVLMYLPIFELAGNIQ